jgi:predicted pyridoxine 5'-phosphate oxidase superfamily flavin-nucleotide-binding protein
VQVLDDGRLTWPEYRGNGVMASLGNISENPHVGLIFMDFVRNVIGLHVNGRAAIVEDDAMRAEHAALEVDDVPGRRPERWVVVEVEEAYIHCAKHIPRMAKVPRERAWGTDDGRRKGGDFFAAAKESRSGSAETPPRILAAPRPGRSDMAAAARIAETADAPAGNGIEASGKGIEASGKGIEADKPEAKSEKELRWSPGRHRRPLRLLGQFPRSTEDR